eukprot:4638447-Alexandrium_andersonii.AAC.1
MLLTQAAVARLRALLPTGAVGKGHSCMLGTGCWPRWTPLHRLSGASAAPRAAHHPVRRPLLGGGLRPRLTHGRGLRVLGSGALACSGR